MKKGKNVGWGNPTWPLGLEILVGRDSQIGQEKNLHFIDQLVKSFKGVPKVLTDDGTC
ncbi:MAG: hypothetical protein CM15mL5_2330 [uncultured marine virus]|nr:MAG: hypothetical protein CM15mL5_2330 [uncultured marine virus]